MAGPATRLNWCVSMSTGRWSDNLYRRIGESSRNVHQDIVDQTIGKVFDYLGIQHNLFLRWDSDRVKEVD